MRHADDRAIFNRVIVGDHAKQEWRQFKLSPRLLDSTYIFKTKRPIWVYFGGPWNEKCWYILKPFGIFDIWSYVHFGHLVYFSRLGMLYQEKSGSHGSAPFLAGKFESIFRRQHPFNLES
jgi:hypothetical protein